MIVLTLLVVYDKSDPELRLTAKAALEHEYFTQIVRLGVEIVKLKFGCAAAVDGQWGIIYYVDCV